jgi:hypothetical protein
MRRSTKEVQMEPAQAKAIALARKAIGRVDRRAPTCPEPACRRHGRCTANPYFNRVSRTGGCPITTPAEWHRINLGIHVAMNCAFAAIDAAKAKTGETFEAAFKRMTMPKPVVGWERRDMIRPLRRNPPENRRSTRSAS